MSVTTGYVGTSPNADPSLEVSLSAVDDPAVSYVVLYSRTAGSLTAPPTGAEEVMTTTANEITLRVMPPDRRNSYTYYIWAAAVSAGNRGEYSDRRSARTLSSEKHEYTCCFS